MSDVEQRANSLAWVERYRRVTGLLRELRQELAAERDLLAARQHGLAEWERQLAEVEQHWEQLQDADAEQVAALEAHRERVASVLLRAAGQGGEG